MKTYFLENEEATILKNSRSINESLKQFNKDNFNSVLNESDILLFEDNINAKKIIDSIKEWVKEQITKLGSFYNAIKEKFYNTNIKLKEYAKANREYLLDDTLPLRFPIKLTTYAINNTGEEIMISPTDALKITKIKSGKDSNSLILGSKEVNKIYPSKAFGNSLVFDKQLGKLDSIFNDAKTKLQNLSSHATVDNQASLPGEKEEAKRHLQNCKTVVSAFNRISRDCIVTMRTAVKIKKKEEGKDSKEGNKK